MISVQPLPSSPASSMPSADALLRRPALRDALVRHGHALVAATARAELDQARRAALAGAAPPSRATLEAEIEQRTLDALAALAELPLKPVVNLTGTVLHTNLGRAALPREATEAITRIAAHPRNLE